MSQEISVTMVENFLCAPNVQNMASDPDFKCGGGKSGAGETAVSQKSHNLLISASLQIFKFLPSFANVLRTLWKTRTL